MDKHRIGKRLLQLKERLEEKKQERAELQGELNSLTTRLQRNFDIVKDSDLKSKFFELDDQLAALGQAIDDKMEEVEVLFEKAE